MLMQLRPWMVAIIGAVLLCIGLYVGSKHSTISDTDCGSVFKSNANEVQLEVSLGEFADAYNGLPIVQGDLATQCTSLISAKRVPTWTSVTIGGLLVLLALFSGVARQRSVDTHPLKGGARSPSLEPDRAPEVE